MSLDDEMRSNEQQLFEDDDELINVSDRGGVNGMMPGSGGFAADNPSQRNINNQPSTSGLQGGGDSSNDNPSNSDMQTLVTTPFSV
jgi:hypothetical protein